MQTNPIHTDRNGVLTSAVVNDGNDPPALGHVYFVDLGNGTTEKISFQRGPVAHHGVNGLTTEALLAICIHRTQVMNSQFGCAENIVAMDAMRQALASLEARTRSRIARGVEGTAQA